MRHSILVAALVFVSSTAFAQNPATVLSAANVISNTDKDRETVTSVPFAVPADVQPGDEVWFRLNIPSTAEYEDTRNRVVISAYVLTDSVWQYAGGGDWIGGHVVNKQGVVNPDPVIGTNADWLAGQQVRMEIAVMRPIRVGATIQVRRPTSQP